MSHRYLKTTYVEEGSYGSEEIRTIYMHQNNSCDVITIYDENFDVILSFGDTTSRPLHIALEELWTDEPEDNNKLSYLSAEEYLKMRKHNG